MVSSACDVLLREPERFVGYILSDPKVRNKIVDEDSVVQAVRTSFKSDPTLANMVQEIDRKGDDLKNCLAGVLSSPEIQKLIQGNVKNREKQIKAKLRKAQPSLKGKALTKEVNKRLKQSISGSKAQVKKLKQVTIAQSLKPVRVKGYTRQGKPVTAYRKTKSRALTKAEEMLIRNNLSKKPSEVVDIYLKSGLTFRTPESVRKHYFRMKMSSP